MSLAPHVLVTVNQQSPSVRQAGFGTALLLEQVSTGVLAARFTSYSTPAEIAASSLPAAAKRRLTMVLAQRPAPTSVMVGRRVPGTAKVSTVTITTADDGTWSFTLNGDTVAYIAGVSDTAQVIAEGLAAQAELIAEEHNVTVGTPVAGVFTITANVAGDDFTVSALTVPGTGVGNTATTTANAAAEDISDALDAIEAAGASFYGLAIDSRKDAQVTEAAAWVSSRQKLFVAMGSDSTIADTLGGLSYENTMHVTKRDAGDDADAAVLGVCMSRNLDVQQITWAYKTLTGVPIDAGVGVDDPYTSAELSAIEADGSNYYYERAGKNITWPGKTVTGEWADVVTTKHYLTARTAEAVFGALAGNPTKTPFDASGAAVIEGALRSVCSTAAAAQHINNDYVVTVPDPATMTSAQRASRTLSGVTVDVTLTGAIHIVDLTINVSS